MPQFSESRPVGSRKGFLVNGSPSAQGESKLEACHSFPLPGERSMGLLMLSRPNTAVGFYALLVSISAVAACVGRAQEAAKPGWTYSEEQLRPFWQGEIMEGESVLFIKAGKTGEARAPVLFPIQKVLSVQSSTGEVRYEEARDYLWKEGSREIVVPPGSRIITSTLDALRRPAKSQKYQLTHRDGNGEIYFGGRLEYHELQTIVSNSHSPGRWASPVPKFDPKERWTGAAAGNERRLLQPRTVCGRWLGRSAHCEHLERLFPRQ